MDIRPYLLIVDLEATCWENKKLQGPNGWVEPQMEIIEIGAQLVKADLISRADGLPWVGEFDVFVKPVINPILSPFCKSLTSITQEQVDGGKPFPEAVESLKAFLADRDVKMDEVTMASWGRYDWSQFTQDCQYHQIPFPFSGEHLNIKQHVSDKKHWSGLGVGKALARMGFKFEGTPHRGIDDTRNILRILRAVGA